MKHFLWRTCSAALPTRESLFKRNYVVSMSCPCCNSDVESIEHLLLFCDWVRRAWFCSKLSIRIEKRGFTSFENWCFKWLVEDKHIDDNVRCFMAVMCWEIWKERCQMVSQHQLANPVLVGIRVASLTDDCWLASIPSTAMDL